MQQDFNKNSVFQWLIALSSDNYYHTTELPIAFNQEAYIGLSNLRVTNEPTGGYTGSSSCRDITLTKIGIVEMRTEGVNPNNSFAIVIGI